MKRPENLGTGTRARQGSAAGQDAELKSTGAGNRKAQAGFPVESFHLRHFADE